MHFLGYPNHSSRTTGLGDRKQIHMASKGLGNDLFWQHRRANGSKGVL